MAYAELNHGRWIIKCPVCPSAQYCEKYGNHWGGMFECVECGAGPVAVDYPDNETRALVETIVAPRPEDHRNWRPGETPERMLTENSLQGL